MAPQENSSPPMSPRDLKDEQPYAMPEPKEQQAANKEEEEVSKQVMPKDFDDLLPLVGEFGLYQKVLFLLLAPFCFFVGYVYFSQIFITLTPDHWCKVPGLEALTAEQRRALAIPRKADGSFEQCRMYGVNFSALALEGASVDELLLRGPDPEWPVAPCGHGWEYDHSEIPYATITTEMDWVCDRSGLPPAAQSSFFVGAIVGGLVFGWVADHYGRIPALVGTNAVGAIAGIATAFLSTSFWAFCALRFCVGLAFDNCFTMMYILVLEYVGPSWRTFVANMSIAIYFTLGTVALPWIAYGISNWRYFAIASSAPLLLAAFTPWLVPESARWLVSQGKVDKAIKIMRKFEKINGKKIDPKVYEEFRESCIKLKKEEDEEKKYSILDIFKTPRMRRTTIILIIIWMIISLAYDGHVRNVGNLGFDLFVTFTVACATELPADTTLIIVLDRWGRRWLACGTLIISGVFSILATAAPQGGVAAALAIMGRFSINISYNIGLQYAAEILPTVVRAQGVAFIHIMGYVANLIAPFVVYLETVDKILPLLVLGILSFAGGVLSLFLPETLDQELPTTLQDGENFGKDQKFWEFPCCGKRNAVKEEEVVSPVGQQSNFYRAGSGRSARSSVRGELYRSSMLSRSASMRSRRAKTMAAVAVAAVGTSASESQIAVRTNGDSVV
ncbi:solute carrier family 22 member 13-like [Ischnura elegans]|uniref:solute carrier family 22 member 13-like n=1 Tax=Ischnura elegans TaxID=197161 RepID=UPI001ED88E44|nr:solute carrier family 22 member 13-like [Ischnura elegans]